MRFAHVAGPPVRRDIASGSHVAHVGAFRVAHPRALAGARHRPNDFAPADRARARDSVDATAARGRRADASARLARAYMVSRVDRRVAEWFRVERHRARVD